VPPQQNQPPPPVNQGVIADLFFPINGVDVSSSLELQTPDTTPLGTNVRAFEPTTNRARGGSRPGLSKFIPAVPSNSSVIQHLNVIVDPQATAIGLSYPPVSGGFPPLNLSDGFVWFGQGSGFPATQVPNLLIITASNQSKTQGTTFHFTGKQFTTVGLMGSDKVNFCDFLSAGQPASAPNGIYAIQCGNANISYAVPGAYLYYPIYVQGTMTVQSNTPPTKVTITVGSSSNTYNLGSGGTFSQGGGMDVGVFNGTHQLSWTASGTYSSYIVTLDGPGFRSCLPAPFAYFSPNSGIFVTSYQVINSSISTNVYTNIGTDDTIAAAVQGVSQGVANVSVSFS
jgi:hypothetical protein